jgi:hypothetical protein
MSRKQSIREGRTVADMGWVVNRGFIVGIAFLVISQIWIAAGFTSSKEGVAIPCYVAGLIFVAQAIWWGYKSRPK